MSIKQAPKWLLSLILCLPVPGLAGEKSTVVDSTEVAKVKTVAKKATRKVARKASLPVHPKRGMTMKQVRKYYGEPRSVRKSKGKVKKKWPRITVWNYGSYSVYFERKIVLHTVVK